MSISRAITQLIKSRVNVATKLSALEEEKEAMLETVKKKYATKETDLKTQLDEAENALKALGHDDKKIKDMSLEFCRDNGVRVPKCDVLE